jgi:hypothetical protein
MHVNHNVIGMSQRAEKKRQSNLKWRELHREYLRQQAKEYRLKNRDHINAKHRAVGKRFREKYREKLRLHHEKLNRQLRFDAVHKIGDKCAHCGITDVRVLQIDHINGGGQRELKKISTQGIYRRILLMPIDECKKHYQILCANCNWIKRYENHEFTRYKTKAQDG